ncbi:MAG TPA: NUDIX hydrolase [Polyangiaceae bacterium]|nr:NUDIX hydrolase [Polyangiaceae bacterium]
MAPPKLAPWKVLANRPLIAKRWLEVHEQRIELGHGGILETFHLIVGPDWTAALALTDEGKAVLVRQYRHGFGAESLELASGIIEPGESPLDAAKRELLEETGYAADDWQPLLSVQTEPARHTTRAHFFFAKGARRVAEPKLDAAENLLTELVDKAELVAMVERGEIVHGVHIAAILLAARQSYW